MTRRSGSSDGTFYFQAWHVAKVVSGESWVQNKDIADFVEQNLSPETKKWLYIKGCVPSKEKPGLLVPYSLCVKLRTPKSGQDPKDAEQALLQFRNKEYPDIAKAYFATKLRKSLDFFNSYSEGADFDSPLANFDTVKSSKKLKERVRSAFKFVKRDFWGDIVHGLVDGVSPKSEFKAARFIRRRGKDPASDPNLLPPTPLQSPLPLPDTSFVRMEEPELSLRPRKTSDTSDITVASTDAPGTDASSVGTVETTQSSVVAEESSSSELRDAKESSAELQDAQESSSSELQDAEESSSELQDTKESSSELQGANESSELQDAKESTSEPQDAKESSSELQDAKESSSELQDAKESSSEESTALEEEEASTSSADEDAPGTTTAGDSTADTEVDAPADVTAADSSEVSYQETATEPTDATSAPPAITTPSSSIVATRRKMSCVSSQGAQTAYFVVQNSGNWLRYLMANHGQSAQKLRSTFFDSPIILAAPLQALNPDGMMRVYFMSQANKQQDEVVCDENGRAIRTRKGGQSVREWVVGTAKISTQALTVHLGKQLENRNARLLPAASPAVRMVDSVVGPNNRLIEMTDAPDIPQAILVTTPHPVEDVREGDIVQEEHDDGFIHIETNILDRPVEEAESDNVDDADKRAKGEGKASKAERKPRSKGKLPSTKRKLRTKKMAKMNQTADINSGARADVNTGIAVDANSVPPRKPSKVYTPPFSRKSWRDVEPQEPQVIYDVMSGYNFLQVEDVQVFSFSTSSHDMMLRTTPAAPAVVEEGDGIGVWSPPVVGIFSWMWDYLAPGGWSKATAAH